MPLKIQNNEPNATIFGKEVNGNAVKIQWGPKGAANDTQRVPDALAEDVDFLNSLDAGVFTVVGGDPEIVAKLNAEIQDVRSDREEAQRRAAANLEATMDRRQDRDIISVTCIGDAPQGRSGHCGKNVLVRSNAAESVPPLCPEHAHLADQFYLKEVGSKGEGATESRAGVVRHEWLRVQMTQPQRSLV